MDEKKLFATNSSALSFSMPTMAMRMNKAPDGTLVPAFIFEKSPRAFEFREDGIEFNVYAPGAKTVEVSGTEGTRWGQEKHPLEHIGDGWWRALIKGIPAGVQFIYYFVDGVNTLYKHAPVCYAHSFVCNFIEVPDPNFDFYDYKDVPHGAVRCEFFESEYTGTLRNCWVYTPPSYDRNPDKEYPVLYMLHGGGENETGWFWQGKIHFILDNLIAAGECEEMIVVTNSGQAPEVGLTEMKMLPGNICELIVRDCIPFIEKRFRVKADKENRALCGLSMGAYQTLQMSCDHPDVFDWLGVFSGVRSGTFREFLKENEAEAYNASHKLLYFSCGLQEGGDKMPEIMAEIDALGIKAESFVCDGVHEWQTWRKSAHDFVKRIFK